MKIDPHKSKQYYESWKSKGAPIEDISKENASLIRKFIFDMENGTNINISNKKGARSYIRLNAYKSKLKIFFREAENQFKVKDITKLKKEQFNKIATELRNGMIKRNDGKVYVDASDYIKSFKAFWHWLQKINKNLEDITFEADVSKTKPKWVYLDDKQFKKFCESCKPIYKIITYFDFDTGLRASELLNARVSWFSDDFKVIDIPEEVSKTIGRKFKLMISRELIKEHIEENKLKDDDLLFNIALSKINEYYKRRAKSLFGEGKSKAGEKYSNLTLGDIRHISACYWLPRYPTQQGMMYRFGWKKADKIFYYSEFLGMQDNIHEDNLLIDVTKTELQKNNEKLQNQIDVFKESYNREIGLLKKQNIFMLKSFGEIADMIGETKIGKDKEQLISVKRFIKKKLEQ